MTTIEEKEAEITLLKQELLVLRRRQGELEDEHKKIDDRVSEIVGSSWGRRGILGKLNADLLKLERVRVHKKLTPVVWSKAPKLAGDYVVTRITPKRIYVSRSGDEHEWYFNKLTGQGTYSEVIDLEATFGDTFGDTPSETQQK